MKNFTTLSATTLCFLLLGMAAGCNKGGGGNSSVDKSPATIVPASATISTEPGREVNIAARIEDEDGLQSVNLKSGGLSLNYSVSFSEDKPVYSYDLDYKFTTAATLQDQSYPVVITVTDLGGFEKSETVTLTMDGDFEAPVFTDVWFDEEVTMTQTGQASFNIKFVVEDNKGLESVAITIPELEYSKAVTSGFADSGKKLEFDETVTLPAGATYHLTVTAKDKAGLTAEKKSTISISSVSDFPKMYLADVKTVEELNSDLFGVPMRMERTGPYQYKGSYYNKKAGTEIFFLPQKRDFAPYCFGLDPGDKTRLTSNPATALPIVLSEAGVYYSFSFNAQSGSFSMSTYSIAEALDPMPVAIGGVADHGTEIEFYIGRLQEDPSTVIRWTQDETNPHLFYEKVELEVAPENESLSFIIHNWHPWGWWDYCVWHADNSADPEIVVYNGVVANPLWVEQHPEWGGDRVYDAWIRPACNKAGNYTIWFDAHLSRLWVVPDSE